jgi:peroxiredoxin (alkyl hydroperoxide reductase subunit C)
MGAELVTVSTDTEFTHLAWQRHEKELADVRYPMGADVTGALARRFGVYDETTGLAHRGAFLIGPDGRLMAMEVTADNIGRNIDELMRKFKASLHVARHPAKACPSKWREEGDRTLEPSAKMVGRVHEALQD